MSETPAFAAVAEGLEERTSLSRLEARGTIRLALKEAGLVAAEVSVTQMRAVLERVLVAELEARGIEGAARITEELAERLASVTDDERSDATPEGSLRRMWGR